MAQLDVEKSDNVSYNSLRSSTKGSKYKVILLLRVMGLLATLAATIVMVLNNETKTFVVATIGTTSLKATLSARFQDTPSNIFFVVVNGLASLQNLLALAVECLGNKIDPKGIRFMVISILDIINIALLSGGTTAATFMAELAKNGNKHARWNKICDRFQKFCGHGGGAILASYIGLAILLVVVLISAIKRH